MEENNKLEKYIINGNIDLNRIVDDYIPYVRTIIQNMNYNKLTEEDKEEIISDTFLILWKKYTENYNINSLSSYIAGITRNLTRNKINSIKETVDIEDCENILKYSNVDNHLEELEEINQISKRIKGLKEIDFKIINMFYYSAESIKDIAKKLKLSEMNVKTRLHRIRKKIKNELKQGGF